MGEKRHKYGMGEVRKNHGIGFELEVSDRNTRVLITCHQCDNRVLVTQSCPILCDPMDYSLPGSSVLGILQARILEWIDIP